MGGVVLLPLLMELHDLEVSSMVALRLVHQSYELLS
jgi:hypothetical protein